MKFIEFAGEMINFNCVSKIFIDTDGVKATCKGGTWLVIGANGTVESPSPKTELSRQRRFSVCIRMGDTYQEYYDTLAQCQERFDSIMRALNN